MVFSSDYYGDFFFILPAVIYYYYYYYYYILYNVVKYVGHLTTSLSLLSFCAVYCMYGMGSHANRHAIDRDGRARYAARLLSWPGSTVERRGLMEHRSRETMRHGLPPGVYTNITCTAFVVSLFITLGLFLTVNVYQLGDAGVVEHGTAGRGSRFRKLTHIPTHPDVFDPSFKRRGDVDDEDLDAENEEIDLTDYSPWYYTYVNSTNQTIDYRRTGTGNIRVCNNGEEPRPTKDMYCMENRLNKKTVILQSGSWIESVIIMWIAEILMREQLQVPVRIAPLADGAHTFFPTQKVYNNPSLKKFKFDKSGNRIYEDLDVLNPMTYAWQGLYNADLDMECSIASKQDIFDINKDLIDHPSCPVTAGKMPSICKPCM